MITITLAGLALTGAGAAAVPVVWRRGDHTLSAACAAGSLALGYHIHPVVDAAVLAASSAYGWHTWQHTAGQVTRGGRRLRRKHGVASTADVLRRGSWLAAHRRAAVIRPSLAEVPVWRRWTVPTRELAVPLCRTGFLRVWSSIELVVLKIGAPRSGKSGSLACDIVDAPGAVIATSTRTDLHDSTAGLRAGRGPISVFNPAGLGDLPSTVGFDALIGCADPTTAAYRAADLISGGNRHGGGSDREYWDGQARRVLTALLHAAALGGLAAHAVAQWVSASGDPGTRDRVLKLLRGSPAAAGYVPDARQFFDTNDKTRSSITSTISPCLTWLTSPAAVAATTGPALDVAAFLRGRGTLYLLGSEEAHTAPLVAALTGHIAREARRIAATCPGGRLDPPLTLVLDEAALICPIPLDRWSADMGGRGVHIVAAFQSRAQILGRWGDTAGRAILANAGAVVLFTQGHDVEDLAHWAKLAGERDEPTVTRNTAGEAVSHSERKTGVLSPAQLTTLRPGRVVVFRAGMHPVLGRAAMAWKRADVKAHKRAATRAARAVVEAATAVTQSARPVGDTGPQLAPTSPAGRAARWVKRRPRRGRVGEPSPASPTGSPASPVPTPGWVVDAHGVAQATNGHHPAGDGE